MREILFRGKRTDNGEWAYGDFIHSWHKLNTKHTPMIYNTVGKVEVDPSTVYQYTGLTDKNGTKIFEGDILSTENGTFSNTGMGHICFYKGMWVSFYGQDALGRDAFDELYTVCNSREVIGNIHDNPELLNEVTENE